MQITNWRKSTYSGDGSNCVEIATTPDAVRVRDSKDADGPRLAIAPPAWRAFLLGMATPSPPCHRSTHHG
ncbi:DUF397 domain-containing protein [Streptomyces minutiscleroticus]|uniref:DUF397 domain-containing protein n=1 Tax=Streptomyces minutiscleroticus TaxID=68238 RepID=UPI00332769C0